MKKIYFFAFLIIASYQIIDRTYFTYLGLSITATSADIQNAYQNKKNKIQSIEDQDQRQKKLSILEQAYNVLSNEEKRAKYERYGKDISKKINEITSINQFNKMDSRKDRSIKLTIPISIIDIYNGTTIKAQYLTTTACKVCQGTGARSPRDMKNCPRCSGKGFAVVQGKNYYGQPFQMESLCQQCKGKGKTITKSCQACNGKSIVRAVENIEFKIPKGLPQGNKIRYLNYGEEPFIGAPSDFQVTVVQVFTQQWSRKDYNLIYTMSISLEESIYGFTKSFMHLSGENILVTREGVTNKLEQIVFEAKGLTNAENNKVGSLTVKFKIVVPKFNSKQLDMWEDFFRSNIL